MLNLLSDGSRGLNHPGPQVCREMRKFIVNPTSAAVFITLYSVTIGAWAIQYFLWEYTYYALDFWIAMVLGFFIGIPASILVVLTKILILLGRIF